MRHKDARGRRLLVFAAGTMALTAVIGGEAVLAAPSKTPSPAASASPVMTPTVQLKHELQASSPSGRDSLAEAIARKQALAGSSPGAEPQDSDAIARKQALAGSSPSAEPQDSDAIARKQALAGSSPSAEPYTGAVQAHIVVPGLDGGQQQPPLCLRHQGGRRQLQLVRPRRRSTGSPPRHEDEEGAHTHEDFTASRTGRSADDLTGP